VIAPGFIDEHTHTDRTIFEFPGPGGRITQGITSEVVCNCGIGPFPNAPEHREELLPYLDSLYSSEIPYDLSWTDFSGFADAVDAVHPGINLLPLTAHGALRMAVMGTEERKASPEDIEKMQQLLGESLQQGAWGMSTGLVYPPGSFADTEELEQMAQVLASCGSVFTSHVRGESGTLLTAIDEILGIGKRTGCAVLISHLKAIGKSYWGDGCRGLEKISRARQEGQTVWADQYPYEATNTGLTVLAPDWAQDGGISGLTARLKDPAIRPRLLRDIKKRMDTRGGPSCVQISNVRTEKGRRYMGKTLEEIGAEENKTAAAAAADLMEQEQGAVSAVYFSLGAQDVETIIQDPLVAVCSDGYGLSAGDRAKQCAVHPRAYGTFPRVLGKYVREKKLLPLERAVWKMTGLPAKAFSIPRRGQLKEGYIADITVFNPDTIGDRATFANPHQYAEGVEYVMVKGVFSLREGRLTGIGNGRVLRRNREEGSL
jgi:N-acyl-D-aspartate/D-glutamate deacylase